jgi:hypothetical protein
MKNKRRLVPGFLQKLDEDLLRNKPSTWAARLHLVIYFGALFAVALALLCFVSFSDARAYGSVEIWSGFTALLAFIGFIFWLIYLLRFNVFKRYGNWSEWDGLKSFFFYFASIAIMVAVAFIPPAVETFNANRQFGNTEIVKDINELNTDAVRLEYAIVPKQWRAETYIVDPSRPAGEMPEDIVSSDTALTAFKKPAVYYIDTAGLRSKLLSIDSVQKINDSTYTFYISPGYVFVHSYHADNYTTVKELSSKDIYYQVIKNYTLPDRAALMKRMQQLKDKYAVDGYAYYYDDPRDTSYTARINTKYQLQRINTGIDNIVNKKYRWREDGWSFFRLFFYTALFFTLLVFIFRHTTTRTFFLSLLAVVLLSIFTGLLMAMFNMDSVGIFSWMLLYYIVFGVMAFSIKAAVKRNTLQGIALNIFLFCTPFLPLFLTAMYLEIQRVAHGYAYYSSANEYRWYVAAEVTGVLLFLVLLQPVFRRLYRRWYALPED